MMLAFISLTVIALFAVVTSLLWPWINPDNPPALELPREMELYQKHLSERECALANLKDLESDLQMKKITPHDAAQLQREWILQMEASTKTLEEWWINSQLGKKISADLELLRKSS